MALARVKEAFLLCNNFPPEQGGGGGAPHAPLSEFATVSNTQYFTQLRLTPKINTQAKIGGQKCGYLMEYLGNGKNTITM